MTSFNAIVNVVQTCRSASGKGSIKAKEALAADVGNMLRATGNSKSTETFLATLFPANHPDKYMPIGLTTLAYTLCQIAAMKKGVRKLHGAFLENPMDAALILSTTGWQTCVPKRQQKNLPWIPCNALSK